MTVQEIYDKYNLMPNLQIHQYRVAAVGQLICESITDFNDTEAVITTCLLHDMGNIIKFDLNYFPEFLQPEGLAYWQQVKDNYIKKYGPDEHHATKIIIEELVDNKIVWDFADQVGFSKLEETEHEPSLAKKICAYSDMRVGPYGVVSIEERITDGRKRYVGRADRALGSDNFKTLAKALSNIEKQIFDIASIRPDYITDELVNERIALLKDFKI